MCKEAYHGETKDKLIEQDLKPSEHADFSTEQMKRLEEQSKDEPSKTKN